MISVLAARSHYIFVISPIACPENLISGQRLPILRVSTSTAGIRMLSVSLPNALLSSQTSYQADPKLTRPQEPVSQTAPAAQSAPPSWAAMPARAPSAMTPGPSTVDMRFEFNPLTHAWMVAMTDANSGDVVRRIDLKGFGWGDRASQHQSGHWIDKSV